MRSHISDESWFRKLATRSSTVRGFCPDGYVTMQEAIWETALCWHAQQLTALEASVAEGASVERSGVEALSGAISTRQRTSWQIQQVFAEIVPDVVDWLRNILHKDRVLTVYYFGKVFSNGRKAINPDFWTTADADGVLETGMFFPFGRPIRSFETRLSFQVLLLWAELEALLTEPPADKKPFPSTKTSEIVAALRELDDLPNRAAQGAAVRDLPQFRGFRITDRILRDAARQAPRPLGRCRNQQSD
jgi:hypothetical protein